MGLAIHTAIHFPIRPPMLLPLPYLLPSLRLKIFGGRPSILFSDTITHTQASVSRLFLLFFSLPMNQRVTLPISFAFDSLEPYLFYRKKNYRQFKTQTEAAKLNQNLLRIQNKIFSTSSTITRRSRGIE